jgi:hypothetical protein
MSHDPRRIGTLLLLLRIRRRGIQGSNPGLDTGCPVEAWCTVFIWR